MAVLDGLRYKTLSVSLCLLVLVAALVFGPVGSHAVSKLRWPAIFTNAKRTPYEVQVFSSDPLILYIRHFVSSDEISHLLKLAEGHYEVSRIWPDTVGYVDTSYRVSESALIERTDVVRRIERRARRIMGWRNNDTGIQPIKVQRYGFNGFYNFHFDYDDSRKEGNRMTTFMVYLVDKCTGGGTNFPRLDQPKDKRWCDVIECEAAAINDYPGVTFKPLAGSAIFWENFYPNGTPHEGTRHAGLPVASGEKIGMNIWSWDTSWKNPSAELM